MNDSADFADPAKLKLFFEELDDSIGNLYGLFQSANCDLMAMKKALLIIVRVMEERLPGAREIVANDLDDEIEETRARHERMRSNRDPEEWEDENRQREVDSLIELMVAIRMQV